MKKRFIIFLLISIIIGIVGFFWFKEATSPVNFQNEKKVLFVVQPGESMKSIASRLKKEGLVRDPLAFFLLVKRSGVETTIQAGDFRLSPSMSAPEILEELQHGTIDVWVTIPEGWRVEEIALKIAQELAIPEREFLQIAEEGYMFPDTYLFPRQATASAAATIMRSNFDKKVDQTMRDNMRQHDVSLADAVILASLVEREAKFPEDRPKIASVLFNRLKIAMKLDIDATVQYAIGYQADAKTWWKRDLTKEDLLVDSPYNTYQVNGLPPGPIANPGLASLRAVIEPEETDYLYYISDSEGKIHFASTFEEHQRNIEQFLSL